MTLERFGNDEFGPVGGVPEYALLDTTDPLAANSRYGNDPDGLGGVSSADNDLTLQDFDGANGPSQGAEAARSFDQPLPGTESLLDDEVIADGGRSVQAVGTGAGEVDGDEPRAAAVADQTDVPTTPEPAEAPVDDIAGGSSTVEEAAESGDAPTAVSPEMGAPTEHAEAADDPEQDPGTDEGDQPADDIDEDPANFMTEELGIDPEIARELVKEAIESQLDEYDEDDVDSHERRDTGAQSEDDAVDEHDGQDEDESDESKGGVSAALRAFRDCVGRVVRQEAETFAEGARAFGGDARQWYDERHERGNAAALAKARKDARNTQDKWDKVNRRLNRKRMEPPRRGGER